MLNHLVIVCLLQFIIAAILLLGKGKVSSHPTGPPESKSHITFGLMSRQGKTRYCDKDKCDRKMPHESRSTAAEASGETGMGGTNKEQVQEGTSKSKKWFPLESNPELVNKYVTQLGFDALSDGSLYEFVDVFSTESWALDMVAQPVAAVLILYPLTNREKKFREQEELDRQQYGDGTVSPDVWYIKQRITNACGTIGLL
jgi:hypothetical protein